MAGMTALLDAWQRSRPWRRDALAGLLALVAGLYEMHRDQVVISRTGELLVVVGVAVAVGLSRLAPGGALATAWCTGGLQVVTGTGPMVCEVLLAVVAFGCARWGSTLVLWLSAVSIPLGAAIAVLWLDPNVFYDSLRVAGVRGLARRAYDGTNGWRVSAALLGSALLMAPWLLGLALRFSERSETSRRSQVAAEAERDQAEEIARLREDQARLARDVHDVVGHSLAVILAQAESAQYLDDADTTALKQTMDQHRHVGAHLARRRAQRARLDAGHRPLPPRASLTSTACSTACGRAATWSSRRVVGAPQPMPPELEVVAFRVLQEMLTNAIKHGRRDRPVLVERHWEGELRIEVQNADPRPVRGRGDPAARGDPADHEHADAADSRRRSGDRRHAAPAGGGRRPARRTPAHRPARPSPPPPGCRWGSCRDRPDPGPARRRPGPLPRGRPGDRRRPGGPGGRRGGRRRGRGSPAGRRARPRRRADGHPDAGDGRRRGDPADLPARPGGAPRAPGAGHRADHLQPRRPGRHRDPVRRQRLPAQGHDAGDAARRDPHRPRRQRRARARRTWRPCWTGSSGPARPPPAAYLAPDRQGARGVRRGRPGPVQHRDRGRRSSPASRR